MSRIIALFVVLLPAVVLADGKSSAPPPGLRENNPDAQALVGARLVVAPGKVIDRGTLVIRQGIIVAAGPETEVAVPDDARRWDLSGRTIYPGFIDLLSEIDAAGASLGGAAYWNTQIAPQVRADRLVTLNRDLNRKLRSQGIAARVAAPSGRLMDGTSALVTTGDDELSRSLLKEQVALHLRLSPRSVGRDEYPNSPMGALSLMRQVFYDAQWYRQVWDAYEAHPGLPRPERNDALAAVQPFLADNGPSGGRGGGLVVIDAPDELYFLRADQVGREFGLKVLIRGSGREYRRLDAIKATGRSVIVPVNFPKAPHVKTPETARRASLESLLHWDLAPENPGRLAKAGVRIALTSHGLPDAGEFLGKLRQAVKRGLTEDAALAALTTAPAEIVGMESRLGTLEVGKSASLIVADGPLFEDKTKIVETWVDGRRYEIVTSPAIDVRGIWQLTVVRADGTSETLSLGLRGEPGSLAGTLSKGDKKADLAEPTLEGAKLQFRVTADEILGKGVSRLSANVTLGPDGDTMLGRIALAEGGEWPLAARRTADLAPAESPTDPEPEAKAPPKTEIAEALFPVNYPLGAFGRPEMPEQQRLVLFKNATVWTSGPQGTLKNASVLVASGKIRAVGQEIEAPEGAVVIDLSGKHLTPGLIDCHSHIATDGGINETGQTITAEVRIGDFVDCDDVNIYRQLAGGVTAANVLHGSANTIGGQNQVIKMRWGALPEEIKFAQAPQGIKFALGENVKQSNWGDKFNTRYPQTRMGVEQLVPNAFEAALAYGRRWEEWEKTKAGLPPRVDLELQTILEILQGKRLIHCHSYRQDEIVALIRTCERYQVRIGTLQHILEGYKIADIIARHGAGGSSFSDWWAYKFEVLDAIPYNGALMHSAGVVVSFNSDDAELARRLNTEAAKAVKYGGVSEVEALKFVTLNPARQLRIDGYVGSIEPGKDADLAVWSAPPLSSRAVCEQSWVDGRKLFDRQEDIAARPNRESMRAALIQRILATNAPMAEPGEPISRRLLWPREDLYCGHHDHGDEEGREQYQQ